MAGLEVKFDGEEMEQLFERLLDRLKSDLEEQLSDLVKKTVEEALSQSAFWVPRQMTTKQVSEILQVPETRARQLMTDGNIPRSNLTGKTSGQTYRVDPRDLNLWLDAHQDFPARRDELRQIIESGK